MRIANYYKYIITLSIIHVYNLQIIYCIIIIIITTNVAMSLRVILRSHEVKISRNYYGVDQTVAHTRANATLWWRKPVTVRLHGVYLTNLSHIRIIDEKTVPSGRFFH